MLYDRSYMRQLLNQNNSSFAIHLIITLSFSFLVLSLFAIFSETAHLFLFQNLSFTTSDHGFSIIWRGFTYLLIHDGPFHLIMNLLGIYFIGRNLEMQIGRNDFMYVCLLSALFGCLSWYFFNPDNQYLVGSSAIVMGCLSCYCLRNPESPITLLLFFVLPCRIKPKWILLTLLCYELYGFIFNELTGLSDIAHSAHLGGMCAGGFVFRYLRSGNRFPEFVFSSNYPSLGAFTEKFKTKSSPKPNQSNYKVNLSKYNFSQEEVDRILDKINESGFGSLSSSEKKTLEAAKELLK